MTYRVSRERWACDAGCCLVGEDREFEGLTPDEVGDAGRPMFEVLDDDMLDCGLAGWAYGRGYEYRGVDHRLVAANAERIARAFIRRLRAAGV